MKQLSTADLIHALRLNISHMSGIHRNTIMSQFCTLLSVTSLGIGLLYVPGKNSHLLFSIGIAAATVVVAGLNNLRAKQLFDEMIKNDLRLPSEEGPPTTEQ